MKIKQRFGLYNAVALLTPIVTIGVISVCMALIFILQYPVEGLGITRDGLFNPIIFVRAVQDFLNRSPYAVLYVIIYITLCVLVMMATNMISSRMMANSIGKSITELKNAAHHIGNGNLDFTVMGSNYDEIDELCDEFDNMRRRLKLSKEKEEAMKRERSMLLANLSHDLRTPVTSIKGYVEGIIDGVADSDEKRNKYLRTVYSKAERMMDIINNMSDLSRLELGKEDLKLEECELNSLVGALVKSRSFDFAERDMDISFVPCDEKLYIQADRVKLERVFINLMENAVKYKGEGRGELLICVSAEDRNAFVTLTDTGIGIDKKELERVFDSFYRADSARTPNIKGSGLGLGIARGIVEKHGGSIWLRSDGRGKGTTATVRLRLFTEGADR